MSNSHQCSGLHTASNVESRSKFVEFGSSRHDPGCTRTVRAAGDFASLAGLVAYLRRGLADASPKHRPQVFLMFESGTLGHRGERDFGSGEQFAGMTDPYVQDLLMHRAVQLPAKTALQHAARQADLARDVIDPDSGG